LYRTFATYPGRFAFLLVVLVAIAAYVLGLNVAYLELAAARQATQQLRADNQKLKTQISNQTARQAALQNKLEAAEAALEAVVPSENTYSIKPNQSVLVANGRLTVGLVGSPTNDGVNININGKKQSAAPGDTINIALDQQTKCQVRVQSFDMFKAILAATCGTGP
jgi:uncharacterized protein YlxW (UPF0749 family)